MKSALPPYDLYLPAREVYCADLPDSLFRTLAQIRGLAYRFRGKRTPALTLDDLAAMRGLSRTTIFRHLAELRARGIIQSTLAWNHPFIIRIPRPKRDPKRKKADRARGKATLPGTRNDGTAAPSEPHHVASSPLRWGSGAQSPAYERGGAAQAKAQGLSQPNLDRHGARGTQPAGAWNGAARRQADLHAPSPGPPRRKKRRRGRSRQTWRMSVKNKGRTPKNGTQCFKNATATFKNATPTFKNETHVVVVHDHDSNREDLEQQHEHERALFKNASDFDGALRELAGALAEHGMPPDSAQRWAGWLLEKYGAEVCARQRQAFERRCELARVSRQGLRNPIGLLCASIRGDWSLPAAENERKKERWYSDEEFELFFEH